MTDLPITLTASDAARLLGVSINSIYDAVRRRDLPHRRLGRRVLIPGAALQAWLAAVETKLASAK